MTQPPGEALRRQTLGIVENLLGRVPLWDLPRPPEALDRARQKLGDNAYDVLVVGEAGCGKSSFVNALVGRDLLPTDVDGATCQVFRVRHSEEEAYRLRFEDGSEEGIGAADLARYGSQAPRSGEAALGPGHALRWIEVETPARFLPPGVTLLDTPGLGALYAARAQITRRFVPLADAVIFVLDADAPIGAPELEAVEQILGVTPRLLFIQTKIDLYRREDWQAVQERSAQILKERFGERLPDARIWPVSSAHVRKAAATGEEAYLVASRYKVLEAALTLFLARGSGWGRTADALAAGDEYYRHTRPVLAERLATLVEESRLKGEEGRQAVEARKQRFEADWGPEKAAEAGAEMERMVEGLKLDDEQRTVKVEEAGERLAEWDALGDALRAAVAELPALERGGGMGV
jgi:ribosome biogenesis GTPase A